MKNEEKFKKFFPSLSVANLEPSATCNLNCNYCYITKKDGVKKIQQRNVEYIKSGKWIKDLKLAYGENLRLIKFWGSEPSLGLKYYIPFLGDLLKEFPKLNSFYYSSNHMTDWKKCHFEFLDSLDEEFYKLGRECKVGLQISLDGLPEINDKNRQEGSTEKIIDNVKKLFNELKNKPLKAVKIESHIKPTWSIKEYERAVEDPNILYRQITFLDELLSDFKNKFDCDRIKFKSKGKKSTPAFLIDFPGEYTTQDGKNYASILKSLNILKDENKEWNYYKNCFVLEEEIFKNELNSINETRNLPDYCSAAKGTLQLTEDGEFLPCHKYLHLDDDDYIDDLEMELKTNPEKTSIPKRSTSFLRKKLHQTNIKRKNYKSISLLYTGIHNFHRQKIAAVQCLILELACAKQISEKYLNNEKLRNILSLFCVYVMKCPAIQFASFSSIYVPFPGIIRLYGNGALEEILKNIELD
jgi:sulfatase maturation enzyme AslB (radical SAM superfamily)